MINRNNNRTTNNHVITPAIIGHLFDAVCFGRKIFLFSFHSWYREKEEMRTRIEIKAVNWHRMRKFASPFVERKKKLFLLIQWALNNNPTLKRVHAPIEFLSPRYSEIRFYNLCMCEKIESIKELFWFVVFTMMKLGCASIRVLFSA